MIDILRALVLPSNICFLLAAIGVVLSVPARTRGVARGSFVAAGLLLTIFSSGKTATWLMAPLEYGYPRVPDQVAPVGTIVVLAGYAANDPDMSLSDRLNSSALYRVVEADLLWRQQRQDCDVVITGRSPTTNVMAELLVALGVPPARVRLDNDAANTGASARNVHRLIGETPFYLVTSAGHLPRAMAVFAAAGTRPLPAPTEHRLPKSVAHAEWRLSPFHLESSDLAVHERIGMWWYRWRGLI